MAAEFKQVVNWSGRGTWVHKLEIPRETSISGIGDSSLPIIDCEVEGEKARMLINTGSSVTLIDYHMLQKIKAKRRV